MVFSFVTVLSCWLSAALESFFPFLLPLAGFIIYVAIVDFRSLFFLLLASIPISTEIEFPNGLSTDLPTEPLIVGLMFLYWLYVLKNGTILRGGQFFRHPITLLILLHLSWIFITMLNSESVVFSIKYFLAKVWYITTFYFLAAWVLKTPQDFKRFFWAIFIPLTFAAIVTLIRHSTYDFSFKDVNKVMYPMFRNHVSYGCIMAVFLPFVVLVCTWHKYFTLKWWLLVGGMSLLLLCIQYSYTRAAYGAVIGAMGYYFIVKYRLTKYVIGLTIIGIIGFVTYIVSNNKYLDYAPKFEKTISHERFDNLLEATAKGEDISTMERVYRWVAGFRMVAEKPFMGYGPNNFYNFYKSYTVTNFETYVSDNKEGSTVHCYYLLMAVEQGIPGAIIFFALIFYLLFKGEQVYHQSEGLEQQPIIMAVLLSFVILLILILINDLIETDKFGSFFFMSFALITNADIEASNVKIFKAKT